LSGGGAADLFRYTTTASGTDTILDFSGVTAFGGGTGDGDRLAFVGLLHGVFDYIEDASFSAGGNSQARSPGPIPCRSTPMATAPSISPSGSRT